MLVDSSVWIDFFNGRSTRQTDLLDARLGATQLITGDLIVAEVLQGFRYERDFERARRFFAMMTPVQIGGMPIALKAAENFRHLRSRGVTVRKTIDCLIATRCIVDDLPLLYSDGDFDPFVEHLGLHAVA